MSQLTATNRMTARQLVIRENSTIDFVKNPNTGKLFFVCGSKQGYVSPALSNKYMSAELEDMQYAEVSMNGGDAVPTLMCVGNSRKDVQRTLGADLLR